MNPPSCYPFPKDDRHDAAMYNRDDEDKQRHYHATEIPQSKPKRRRIRQTKRNQKKIKPKSHLLYHSDDDDFRSILMNSNGTFEPTARCRHQDNRGTDCTRMALIKETPFCFEHMPAPIKRKFLPPPELEGSPEEQDLTKFVFWMQSRGGTDKDWSTKTNKERKKFWVAVPSA